ncbi:cation transporter [Thiospirochaeta perfilievii]|uniref:Cation transporter n=1 Tax=Thiospirochaeta perfilievii TaxID=252967 RepID=A0A5C1Q7U3_9SPIO|nr:CDF family Co(II)/Ni(II) efflux transporter DmeF [Thiospirochaeta perfilievii]QEN03457.1 cation transporter [Thiospirochaeta perfilievii]
MRVCNQDLEMINNSENMKRTGIVVLLTLITMIAEIVYGLITGSMSLLADGIHMGTHTFALIITFIAYLIAKNHFKNPNFQFSTGKIGILGGYSNSIVLGITAIFMIYEAIHRIISPQNILFNQAIFVAIIGLVVNVISAIILSQSSSGHEHNHSHSHDHNLRAAYIHVLTDALTSILAIFALLLGKYFDQIWPDAVVAILGAIVILKWAHGLLVSSGKLLVDYYPSKKEYEIISKLLEESKSSIFDLHLWQISETSKALILTIKPGPEFNKKQFYNQVRNKCEISHITIELN